METQANTTTALATLPPPGNGTSIYDSPALFDHGQRVALSLTQSTMVPDRYRGEANVGNALIALDIAWRMGKPPLFIMQQLFVVYGTPSWSGQMVRALIAESGLYTEVEYEFKGKPGEDAWGCRLVGKARSTGKVVFGPWVDIAMAKAEGWYADKTDKQTGKVTMVSKWKTNPDLMLRYRASSYFGKTECPHVLFGLGSKEEAEDVGPQGENTFVGGGPTIDVPALGDEPATTETSATEPPKVVNTPPVPAKQVGGKGKAKKEAPPATTPPAAASTPPPPPAAAAAPATPTPPPPAQTPPAQTTPPAQEQAQEQTPADTKPLPVVLAEKLKTDGVPVDDFCDWLQNTGIAHQFGVNMDNIDDLGQLPENLINFVMFTENGKKWNGLVKIFGGQKS